MAAQVRRLVPGVQYRVMLMKHVFPLLALQAGGTHPPRTLPTGAKVAEESGGVCSCPFHRRTPRPTGLLSRCSHCFPGGTGMRQGPAWQGGGPLGGGHLATLAMALTPL